MKGVSVIICCYNSEKRLPDTLKHLANQEVPNSINWEVILVDNNSSDNTSIVARQIWETNWGSTQLEIIQQPVPGLYHARELGIKKARFEYIIFCDDDNWLNSDYVEKVYNILSINPNIGILGGQTYGVYEKMAPEWFLKFSNFFAIGKQNNETGWINKNQWGVWGAASAYNKTIFNKLDSIGFKPILLGRTGKKMTSGEDREVCLIAKKLGFGIYYDSMLLSAHYMPSSRFSKAKFFEMCFWNGYNLPLYVYLDNPDRFSFKTLLNSIVKGYWFIIRNRKLVNKEKVDDLAKTFFEVQGTLKRNLDLLIFFTKYKTLFIKYNSNLLLIKEVE